MPPLFALPKCPTFDLSNKNEYGQPSSIEGRYLETLVHYMV